MYKAMIKKSKNKKGFTLVELIVVMAILAILAAILIPAVGGMIRRSNRAVDNANARNFYMAGSMLAAESKESSVKVTKGAPSWPEDTDPIIIQFMGEKPPSIKEAEYLELTVGESETQPGMYVVNVNAGGKAYSPDTGTIAWDADTTTGS